MLKDEIKNILQGKKFITALNSEPYTHVKTLSGIHIKRGSGGAQHLMDYIFKKTGGTNFDRPIGIIKARRYY
jgi:hypothetical protein